MTKKQKTMAAWIVVIIAFFGGFALANVQNKVPPVIDVIMQYFDIGETDAGVADIRIHHHGHGQRLFGSDAHAQARPEEDCVISLALTPWDLAPSARSRPNCGC